LETKLAANLCLLQINDFVEGVKLRERKKGGACPD